MAPEMPGRKKGGGILAGGMPAATGAAYLSGVPAYARCWRLYSAISASASASLPSARILSISASQVRASRRQACVDELAATARPASEGGGALMTTPGLGSATSVGVRPATTGGGGGGGE